MEELRFAQRAEVIPAPGDDSVGLLGDDARQLHGFARVCVDGLRADEDLLIDSRATYAWKRAAFVEVTASGCFTVVRSDCRSDRCEVGDEDERESTARVACHAQQTK